MVTTRIANRRSDLSASGPWWTSVSLSWPLIAVLTLGVGLPVVIAALSGNLSIPHNDAWSYSRIASTFWHTGRIELSNWNNMSLIGQLFLVGPLGTSVLAQQLGVAVLGAVALGCCYALVRTSVTAAGSVLATALVALWPGFASLTTSFMTDVPALAGVLLALVLARRALRLDSRRWLLGAMLVALWAATVREQSLAVPVSVAIYGLLTRRSRTQITAGYLLVVLAGFFVLVAVFLHWRSGLPNPQNPLFLVHLSSLPNILLNTGVYYYFTLAGIFAPVSIWKARPWAWGRLSWALVFLAVLLILRVEFQHLGGYVAGNYYERQGEYGGAFQGDRSVLPGGLWAFNQPLAIVGGLALAGDLGAGWRRVDPLLGIFTLLFFLGSTVVSAIDAQLLDRYLLEVAPGVLAVVLATGKGTSVTAASRPRRDWLARRLPPVLIAAALVSFVVMTTMSVMLALNAFAFDAARWHAATKIEATGLPADRIDAGIEWDGWHSPYGVVNDGAYYDPVGQARSYQYRGAQNWQAKLDPQAACVMLTASPIPFQMIQTYHWRRARVFRYKTVLVSGESRLYSYRMDASGCPEVPLREI